MEQSFKRKTVEISFRKFHDYSEDLLKADFHTFETRLNILIYFCDNDKVMKIVTSPLKEIDVKFDEWWEKGQNSGGSMVGSNKFILPLNEEMRDALLYQFCEKINNKQIDVLMFALNYFGATKFDTGVRSFCEAVIKPMTRSISYKIEEIQDSIKDLTQPEVPYTTLNVYNINNSVSIGDSNTISDSAMGEASKIEYKENN